MALKPSQLRARLATNIAAAVTDGAYGLEYVDLPQLPEQAPHRAFVVRFSDLTRKPAELLSLCGLRETGLVVEVQYESVSNAQDVAADDSRLIFDVFDDLSGTADVVGRPVSDGVFDDETARAIYSLTVRHQVT